MKRVKRQAPPVQDRGWSLIEQCEGCGQSTDRCRCSRPVAPSLERSPTARLQMQKRRGKPVVIIQLEGLTPEAVRLLGKELKVLCGSGGTVKGDEIEIQGDHREKIRGILRDRGTRVKG